MTVDELLGMKKLAMRYGDPIRSHILLLIATIEVQREELAEKDKLIDALSAGEDE